MPGRSMYRLLATAVASAVLALAISCATPRLIRDAQDSFSQAAQSENDALLNPQSAHDAVMTNQSAADGYRVALGLVDRELAEHEADLRQDRLFATAHVLRALCLWRIEGLDPDPKAVAEGRDPLVNELTTIDELRRDPNFALGTRDNALVIALPGLHDHDIGLVAPDYPTAAKFFQSALDAEAKGIAALPANHPLRPYLLLSQFAALRAWYAAADRFLDSTEELKAWQEIQDKARLIDAELAPLAKTDPALAALRTEYFKSIGMTPPKV